MIGTGPFGRNRTVFISGITSGIGREIAKTFALSGWDIVGHYYTAHQQALALKASLEENNVSCCMLQADLSSEKQIDRLASKLAKLDVSSIINNAGSYIVMKHFEALTAKDIMKTFMVNTIAPILISSSVYSGMQKRRFGRIVNISSIAAKYGGSAHSLHYGCSKRALEGLTKSLAREGAKFNVLLNTLRLGVIDTEFHTKFPKDMASRIKLIPVKHMGLPQDIADVAYYLGSDRNKFITNEIIAVAGGE